jgi:hypothetical protein
MPTIWISPTDFIGGPSLVITYPFPGHPSAQIQTTTPGTHRLLMALRLPEDVRIDAVTVCYQVGNPLSAISRLQLLEMGSPGTAPAIHDDTTTLQSTAPACHTSNVGGQVPTVGTALTLALELSFLSAVHRILLGGIGVKVSRIDGCENRHSLGEFGPYASVADARATFQQALATLIADGGGVLCIPRDAPEGFFPRNLEQSDKDGPAVTVLDYRKGFARLHALRWGRPPRTARAAAATCSNATWPATSAGRTSTRPSTSSPATWGAPRRTTSCSRPRFKFPSRTGSS